LAQGVCARSHPQHGCACEMAKAVLREFGEVRNSLAAFKAQHNAWEHEWSAEVERSRDKLEKANAELDALTVSHGKQVDQWELEKSLEKGRQNYQLAPETEYLAKKLREAYTQMALLVDESLRAKAALIATRERLRTEEDGHRKLRGKWEKLRELAEQQGAAWLPPKFAQLLGEPLAAMHPPRWSGVEFSPVEAAVAKAEDAVEAVAKVSPASCPEPEAEQEVGETSANRSLREQLRYERARVQKLENEVNELNERERERQGAERDCRWAKGRVELLEAQLRETRGSASEIALPYAHEALAAVDKKEMHLLKIKVTELQAQLDNLRLRRWPGNGAQTASMRHPWPSSEWVHLSEMLDEFVGACDEQIGRDPVVLTSRARELARICAAAASAQGPSVDVPFALREELQTARRECVQFRRLWCETRSQLFAKPKLRKLTLLHMDCCLKCEELETELKSRVAARPALPPPNPAAEDREAELEDYLVRTQRLEMEIDEMSHENSRMREELEEAANSRQLLQGKNRELGREAAEAKAQLNISVHTKDMEIENYLVKIRRLDAEKDEMRREMDRRAQGLTRDPLAAMTSTERSTPPTSGFSTASTRDPLGTSASDAGHRAVGSYAPPARARSPP